MSETQQVQSKVEELSPVEVELNIEVAWEKVQQQLEEAYRKLQKTARVRGFRPGKVPRHVLKQLLGKSVKSEVAQELVQQSVAEAIQQHELHPVAMPSVEEEAKIAEGKPLAFKAKVEVQPKIDSVDLSSLEVTRQPAEVDPKRVQDEIENLREQNAELITPEPMRPATKGDVLTLDYTVEIDGEPQPELGATDHQLEVGSERLLPEFETGLIGLTPGSDKTLEVSFDDNHQSDKLRGKTALFHIKVKQLHEKRLPTLDDEFAKDVEYDSLAALREDIEKRLQDDATQRSDALLREAVVDALVDRNPVPVPPTLVQQQQRAMLQEMVQLQYMMGNRDPGALQGMIERLGDEAERKVRAALLFRNIAQRENLAVSPEEVERELEQIAQSSGKHIAKVRAEHQGKQLEALESRLLERKLLEYLLAKATIKDKDEEPQAEAVAETTPETDSGAATDKDDKDDKDEGTTGKSAKKKAASRKAKAAREDETAADKELQAPKSAARKATKKSPRKKSTKNKAAKSGEEET